MYEKDKTTFVLGESGLKWCKGEVKTDLGSQDLNPHFRETNIISHPFISGIIEMVYLSRKM
jgi:hypothetical protein